MKKQTNTNTRARVLTLLLCAATCAAFAQDPWSGPGAQGGQGGPGGPGGNHHPPLPPVIQALDTNHDGIIEPDEIANAAQSLKTLLKSGSTSLSIPDLLGPPRHGPRPQGPGQGQGRGQGNQGGPDLQLANPGAQAGPPPQDGQGGPGAQAGNNQDGPPGPPPGPNGRHHPPSPLFQALDTNHDGILEADEIANAAQSLKKLEDANGQITLKELRPPPPPDWQAPPNPPAQSGTSGQTGAPPPPPPPPPE